MIGAVFLLLLSAAAFTSMVALLEVPVAMAVHRPGLRRWSASGIVGGVLVVLFVGWRVKAADSRREADLAGSGLRLAWLWLLRILVPVTILAILAQSASTL